MRRYLLLMVLALVLAGCVPKTAIPTPIAIEPTSRAEPQGEALTPISPTPTPSPTATPEAAGPLLIEGQQAQRLIGDPQSGILYAYTPAGLYRTADGGRSWQLVAAEPAVEGFVFSPSDPNVLYSGEGYPCYRGGPDVPFLKSTDGGATWFGLLNGLNLAPAAVHPADPNLVYAIGCDGPYRSHDGGGTWERQRDDIFGIYDVKEIVPVGDWQVVYIGGVSEGGAGAIIKSEDGGRSWRLLTEDHPGLWWISALAVDPSDPSRAYFAEPNGFWHSADSGGTWERSTVGLEDVIYREDAPFDRTYGLQAIALDPRDPNRLYLGTVRGVYVSADGGESWRKFEGREWEDEEVIALLAAGGEPTKLYITTARGVYVFYPSGG